METGLSPDFVTVYEKAKAVLAEVKKVVVGKDDVILKTLIAMMAEGHILIEDVPGVGKTTLALAFSKAMQLDYNRMQFTPDVLPTDVVGFSMYDRQTGDFRYRQGAAFCNLFLADEINRTSSKTQSALLELMEEGSVTVDGTTRMLPQPFLVIATQNPIGSVGTHMLPESQLDRFMIRISMGYPDTESEISLLKARHHEDPMNLVNLVISREDLLQMQAMTEQVEIQDKLYKYAVALAEATRSHPMIRLGLSPRGTLAIVKMAKAVALVSRRDYVIPEDVKLIFADVSHHRILFSSRLKAQNRTEESVLEEILQTVPVPQ